MKTFFKSTLIFLWGLVFVIVLFFPSWMIGSFGAVGHNFEVLFRFIGLLGVIAAFPFLISNNANHAFGAFLSGTWGVLEVVIGLVVIFEFGGPMILAVPFEVIGTMSLATFALFISYYPVEH